MRKKRRKSAMNSPGLDAKQAGNQTCEQIIQKDVVWLEKKLEELDHRSTREQKRIARRLRALLDYERKKLDDLRKGKPPSWCDDYN